jgi:hypothetical protein
MVCGRRRPVFGAPGKCVIDENPTHHLRRYREEVCPILPLNVMNVNQLEERFIH